jgi:hypothetical protein
MWDPHKRTSGDPHVELFRESRELVRERGAGGGILNRLQRFFGIRPPGTAVSPLRDPVSQLPFFPAEFFA